MIMKYLLIFTVMLITWRCDPPKGEPKELTNLDDMFYPVDIDTNRLLPQALRVLPANWTVWSLTDSSFAALSQDIRDSTEYVLRSDSLKEFMPTIYYADGTIADAVRQVTGQDKLIFTDGNADSLILDFGEHTYTFKANTGGLEDDIDVIVEALSGYSNISILGEDGASLVLQDQGRNDYTLRASDVGVGDFSITRDNLLSSITIDGSSGGVEINYGLTVLETGDITLGLVNIIQGTGDPEGSVTAPAGSMYLNSSAGTGTTLYIKESGSGNTGWIAK